MTAIENHSVPLSYAGLGQEVPVATIDRELKKLWELDEARTNASLMNLVIYSEKPGALLENSAIIRNLTTEHACRAILVEINRKEPQPDLRAWITAHCHLSNGRKSVCCEQIAFYLAGKVTGRFRNTVFAHLNSDLPLVFWWQGELSDILTERLVCVIDRLIVDSSSWADSAASFQRIVEASQSNFDLIIHDHEWARSAQFRLGVASIFDDPLARHAVPEIDRVEITYHPGHWNCALQLLAWLAVQAGWQDLGEAADFSFKSSSGKLVAVALVPDAAVAPVSSLVIQAGQITARITQATGASHVERELNAPGYHVTSLAPVDPSSPECLVALHLERSGKNSLFMKILPRFRRMLEHS